MFTHMVAEVAPEIPVVFLDTGYHFKETLETRDRLVNQEMQPFLNTPDQFTQTTGGNPGLKPETADTYTAGLVFSFDKVRWSMDWFKINLLDAMVECGVKKFIFSSTCATYAAPKRSDCAETPLIAPRRVR